MDQGREDRLDSHRTLWPMLPADADCSSIVASTTRVLQGLSSSSIEQRVNALVLRSSARHRIGLHVLARADALSAQREHCDDARLLLRIAYALADVDLPSRATDTLAKARHLIQTSAASAGAGNQLLQQLSKAEAVLTPSACTRLPSAVLVRIFAALHDVSSRARCMSVCKSWNTVLQHHPALWADVRLWKPFRLPTLAYYIDDEESAFPPPRTVFARTSAALLACARRSRNRLQHVSLDLRTDPIHQQQLMRVWAALRRSAPSLRTLKLCFNHADAGAHAHLGALLRASTRLEYLTLYYAPARRTEIEQPYQPLLVDLRLDDPHQPFPLLRVAHLYLPECDIVFDELLIQRLAALEEFILVRGVFEPLSLTWYCDWLSRAASTLRMLQLGCAIDADDNPRFDPRSPLPPTLLPRLEVYRLDTTEVEAVVRALQARIAMPALRELELCNLDPEAIIWTHDADTPSPFQPAVGSFPARIEGDAMEGLERQPFDTESVSYAADGAGGAAVPGVVLTQDSERPTLSPETAPAAQGAFLSSPHTAPSELGIHAASATDSNLGLADTTSQRRRKRPLSVLSTISASSRSSPAPHRSTVSSGVLSVGGTLERLETLTLRTVSVQEEAAVVQQLRCLAARSLAAFEKDRWRVARAAKDVADIPMAREEDEGVTGITGLDAAEALNHEGLSGHASEGRMHPASELPVPSELGHLPMLMPCLTSLTIQDHVTITNDVIAELVEARLAYVREEEHALAAVMRTRHFDDPVISGAGSSAQATQPAAEDTPRMQGSFPAPAGGFSQHDHSTQAPAGLVAFATMESDSSSTGLLAAAVTRTPAALESVQPTHRDAAGRPEPRLYAGPSAPGHSVPMKREATGNSFGQGAAAAAAAALPTTTDEALLHIAQSMAKARVDAHMQPSLSQDMGGGGFVTAPVEELQGSDSHLPTDSGRGPGPEPGPPAAAASAARPTGLRSAAAGHQGWREAEPAAGAALHDSDAELLSRLSLLGQDHSGSGAPVCIVSPQVRFRPLRTVQLINCPQIVAAELQVQLAGKLGHLLIVDASP